MADGCRTASSSPAVSTVGQLLDVLHQAVELPLSVHLGPASQGEALQPFVVSQVAEHGLHGGEALRDPLAPLRAVDPALHPVGRGLLGSAVSPDEDRHLSHRGLLGMSEALGSLGGMCRRRSWHR